MFLIGFHCHTSQLWHTCGRKWEGAYSVVLRLEKESYVWEIKPVSIIIHLVGGGVRWQTAYLLSDGSYAAVVCLRVFACARSCACVWVEGGGRRRKRERAWQMVQAGRWCISVGSGADAGVEFHTEREREKETNSRQALPQIQRQARRWCLVPRQVTGKVAVFLFWC